MAKVSWTYALKAFEWARKYGLRICLDLHTAPGSQNGYVLRVVCDVVPAGQLTEGFERYNHSGQYGPVNFLNGVMVKTISLAFIIILHPPSFLP